MERQRKDVSDEILKTATDMLKAYIRENPDSIKGSNAEAILELHKRFVEGLAKQTAELLAEPPPPKVEFRFVQRDASKAQGEEHP